MATKTRKGLTRQDFYAIGIVVVFLAIMVFAMNDRIQAGLNMHVTAGMMPFLLLLLLLGAVPFAGFAAIKTLALADKLQRLKAAYAPAEGKAAQQHKDALVRVNGLMLGTILGGFVMALIGGVGLLWLNSLGSGDGLAMIAKAERIEMRADTTSGSQSATPYCLVTARLSDDDTITIRKPENVCRSAKIGDDIVFSKQAGLFGLTYYRLM